MRVLVNTKDNNIRITNPRYFIRAFLQKDYKLDDEAPVLEALNKAFATLLLLLTSGNLTVLRTTSS